MKPALPIAVVVCACPLFGQTVPVESAHSSPQAGAQPAVDLAAEAERNGWKLQTDDKAAWLYVCEYGRGEPVVVLHGGPGADHRYMVDVGRGLEDRFRFVFYDQRGGGLSHCAKESISLANNAEDLETVRRA